jgi:hypothetical protein
MQKDEIIVFLMISHNSVGMDAIKVSGIADWPAPSCKKDVQSFLGFVNFYCRFIQDFSHHAHPLFDPKERCSVEVVYGGTVCI